MYSVNLNLLANIRKAITLGKWFLIYNRLIFSWSFYQKFKCTTIKAIIKTTCRITNLNMMMDIYSLTSAECLSTSTIYTSYNKGGYIILLSMMQIIK